MPISVPAGSTVAFTFTGSDDVTAWSWNFGDGNTSSAESPTNTYAAEGTYTVVLIITSPLGYATLSDIVTVYSTGDPVGYTAPDPAYSLTPGWDPQIMLRISNDGGKTWGNEHWRSAGKLGEYRKRVIWNRLGQGRRRVLEVVMTDPVPFRITGCYLDSMTGNN